MKITNIEAIPVPIPFTLGGPLVDFTDGKNWTELGHLLVRVDTDAGITGYGEAFGFNAIQTTKTAIDTLIAPLALGRAATQIDSLMDDLALKTHIFGRYGVTTFALSGLDIALWDIAGKACDRPVYQLLGGPHKKRFRAYCSILFGDTPEETYELGRRFADQGFTAVKFGWGPMGQDEKTDIALVREARRGTGRRR